MEVRGGRLIDDSGQPVPFQKSLNHSGELIEPSFLIMHYTGGRGLQQSCDWLCNPKAKASAHLVIGRDGKIVQLVPFNKRAWHAGRSCWPPKPWYGNAKPTTHFEALNAHSIGIELDNTGRLKRRADGKWYAFDKVVPEHEVILARHKNGGEISGWQTFPEVQVLAAYAAAEGILASCPSIKRILGHDDIAPRRKIDPGPAFDLEQFSGWLFGRS